MKQKRRFTCAFQDKAICFPSSSVTCRFPFKSVLLPTRMTAFWDDASEAPRFCSSLSKSAFRCIRVDYRYELTLDLLDDVEALQVVNGINKDEGVVKIGAEVLRNERVLVLTALSYDLTVYLLANPFRRYRGCLIHKLCCWIWDCICMACR